MTRRHGSYWRSSYDWRKHETRLNAFPQFTNTIDGTTLHFVHIRSPEPEALPLILTHGWPGSIVELTDIIGALSDPRGTTATQPTPSTWLPCGSRLRILGTDPPTGMEPSTGTCSRTAPASRELELGCLPAA